MKSYPLFLVSAFTLIAVHAAPAYTHPGQDHSGKLLRSQATPTTPLSPTADTTDEQFNTDEHGLPILNSLPGAVSSIYLDFDGGHYSSEGLTTTYAPFGFDVSIGEKYNSTNDTYTYSFDSTEQALIYNTWRDVAAHFAIFDINVTTVEPDNSVNPKSHILISPSHTGGVADAKRATHGDNGFATARYPAGNLTTSATIISHELAHILGLSHQAAYKEDGTWHSNYRGADALGRAPIIGFADDELSVCWDTGYRPAPTLQEAIDLGLYQDDVAVISNTIITENKEFTGNSYSGDGFRPDDTGDDAASARPIELTALFVYPSSGDIGAYSQTDGVIERLDDIDMFAFNWAGGSLGFRTHPAEHIVEARPQYTSSLQTHIKLYDEEGNRVIASYEGNAFSHNILTYEYSFPHLQAGTYFFSVEGLGGYYDRGMYNVFLSGPTPEILAPPTIVTEPVTELEPEPVIESVTEPVTESVTEPVTEPLVIEPGLEFVPESGSGSGSFALLSLFGGLVFAWRRRRNVI